MLTVSRCRPKVREASRMLIPSTITARRTRRYTSTLYILGTIRRVGYYPMNDGGRYSFQPPNVLMASESVLANWPAEMSHYTAGKSRQGAPVLQIQIIPSTDMRLSLPFRPGLPGLSGNMGSIRFHCRSVKVILTSK